MLDLRSLLTAHPFPAALDRIRGAFARQPDCQTCGASAIRHGLLLGGLTVPTASLEALLDIRAHQGTPPARLRACLAALGLEVRTLRKPVRQSTEDFLDGLRVHFAAGGFLIPCVLRAEHWVCVGAWRDGRVGLVDSFFDSRCPGGWRGESPGLCFFNLAPAELDALDWQHHLTLVLPGRWRAQFAAWLPARSALLRLHPGAAAAAAAGGRGASLAGLIRQAAHQYLDDAEYGYRGMLLNLRGGARVSLRAEDPGADAVGISAGPAEEVLSARRLGGALAARGGGRPVPPVLVLRTGAVGAMSLVG